MIEDFSVAEYQYLKEHFDKKTPKELAKDLRKNIKTVREAILLIQQEIFQNQDVPKEESPLMKSFLRKRGAVVNPGISSVLSEKAREQKKGKNENPDIKPAIGRTD